MSNRRKSFRELLFTLSFLALTLGCASAPPLPEDTRVIPPRGDIPRAIANYSGIWQGNWGQQPFKVVIESIDPTRVKGIYSWGEWRST